jgi:hypothetical protein
MNRRTIMVLLAGLNGLLAAALLLSSYSPSAAYAQLEGRPGEYMLISARAAPDNDVVFMLDTASRQLHAFRTTYPRMAGQPIMVGHVHTRDLTQDFAGPAGGRR